jgi:proliferating cell nuclear antigen
MSMRFEVRTVQAGAVKTLVEALKDLLTDTSIEVDPNVGMKIVTMDSAHVVLVHLCLEASKFEYFQCKERFHIGVNMMQLHKLIRTINNNDMLTLFVEDGDLNHLGIKIENSEKAQRTTYRLNLLDLDHAKISIDPVEFQSIITLPSTDFQKIVRDMGQISDTCQIFSVRNQLIFKCSGDYCQQETVMTDNDDNNHNIQMKDADDISMGAFSLKYLVLFSKCTNLSNSVQLFLTNNYPLILVYQIASLGEIKLALAPQSGST